MTWLGVISLLTCDVSTVFPGDSIAMGAVHD